MANQTTLVERIEARVQREDSGQIAVGAHVLRTGSVHGGIVDVAATKQQPQPRGRPVPIQLRPRPFPAILDRIEETAAAIRALETLQSVELFGEIGIGKTVVLRHLAHTVNSKLFQDGVIYRDVRGVPPEDILQLLWGDFLECDVPFRPTDSQLRHDLQTKNALVILDGAELSRTEAERVMNVAAGCTFLLGSADRHLWGSEAHATQLAGLPANDVKALIERELSRPLTADEALTVEPITVAFKGNPLRILQEVAMARLNDRALTSVVQDLRSDGSPEKFAAHIAAPLSSAQRRILSALAIFNGAPVQTTTLSELLQIDHIEPILEELEERHLVRTHASSTRTPRTSPNAGFAEPDRAEFRNYPSVEKLTRPSQTPIQFAFVSYAREDAEFVLRLAKDLRVGGAGVWVDQLDIAPGQRWDRAVEDALAKCLQLVVILSPAAVESTNVMDEVSLALEDGKTVVPVLHRQCKIPFRLRRLQYVDLSVDYKAGHDRLLQTLGAELRPPPGTADTSRVKVVRSWFVNHVVADSDQPATSSKEKPEDAVDVRSQRRYTLAGEFGLFMPEGVEATEERKRAVAYFADWVEPRQRDVKTILETLPVLMDSLRWGVKFGMAAEVMRITRSLELPLVLTGRWESWTNALFLAAQSATAAGDKAALAWVRHQDGTKAICEGNFSDARQSLDQALQIREELRDKAGAGVTRHNLRLVAPPTIPTWKLWKLLAGLGAVICAVIVGVAVASKFHLWSRSATPAPPVTSITTPAPPAAIPAPPVTSITTPAPPAATSTSPVISITTPAPAVAVATPPLTVATPVATMTTPTGITTPVPMLSAIPSIGPNVPLTPPPTARIVRFTGTPTTIVRGESAKLSYKLENAERASIDPSVGEVDSVEGNVTVSPVKRTEYTLIMFGRDGIAERERITIDVQPRRREKPKSEVSKKRDKSSPVPDSRVRESSDRTRGANSESAPRGSLQIGIGPAGVRIPIGGGRRAPTPTPTPRTKIQTGIGRGYYLPDRP
ncbi:MAG TPA: toll/interleukin-1 receptor domain-containing protein [Candidatus Udaeobacter sp.]|nr:toll/interleukin-1 receptor domain-containing protein [Candidatus Udaeobacter sp.]